MAASTIQDKTQDSYDEYLWVGDNTDGDTLEHVFERIGNTQVDLSPYAKTEDIPTKTSDLENDSDFQTSSEVGTAISAKLENLNDRVYATYTTSGSENVESFLTDIYINGYDKLFIQKAYRNDVTDTAVDGQYVSAVSQKNDRITVTRASLPTVTDSAVSGQYISSVSQTDGKITVTRATLPESGTSDTPIPNDTIDSIFTEVFS